MRLKPMLLYLLTCCVSVISKKADRRLERAIWVLSIFLTFILSAVFYGSIYFFGKVGFSGIALLSLTPFYFLIKKCLYRRYITGENENSIVQMGDGFNTNKKILSYIVIISLGLISVFAFIAILAIRGSRNL